MVVHRVCVCVCVCGGGGGGGCGWSELPFQNEIPLSILIPPPPVKNPTTEQQGGRFSVFGFPMPPKHLFSFYFSVHLYSSI